MIQYPTFDIPKFLDIHFAVVLIGIVAVVLSGVLFFIYAHNTKTVIFPSGRKVVKRPSDALPATSLTISIFAIIAISAVYFFSPAYNDRLMSAAIEKDYNVKVLTITKSHSVAVATNDAVYSCSINSADQKKYSVLCRIAAGNMPLDWVMKNKVR